MAHRESPNPYRPYYIPPSIGPPAGVAPSPAQPAASSSSASPHRGSFGTSARDILLDLPGDYSEYLDKSEALGFTGAAKRFVDQAIWSYTSVLFAQPFEVARIVLQVREAGSAELKVESSQRRGSRRKEYGDSYSRSREHHYDSGSDEDDVRSYFSSAAPDVRTTSQRLASRHARNYSAATPPRSRSRSLTPTPPSSAHHTRHDSKNTTSSSPSQPEYRLKLKANNNSLLEVLSQLWGKEAAWGLWKGTNCTFVYNVLLHTIESWTRSLLAAVLNLPEPVLSNFPGTGGIGLDIIDSPDPFGSLGVAVLASGIAGLLLAPLDLTRTRLILTPTSHQPRAIIPSLRSLPKIYAPPSILPAVALHSCVPTAISTFTPVILRSSLGLDPVITPAAYGMATFLSQLVELFAKLPLETILRRGQVDVLQKWRQHEAYTTFQSQPTTPRGGSYDNSLYESHSQWQSQPFSPEASSVKIPEKNDALPTIVPVGPYRGVFGTAWYIVREEGTRPAPIVQRISASASHLAPPQEKKGQGFQGLWRGWRVGFWGLVGVWSAAALGPGSAGGEF